MDLIKYLIVKYILSSFIFYILYLVEYGDFGEIKVEQKIFALRV
jgi:hypothetical protein